MKWIAGLTKHEHLTNWHKWFAWYPITVAVTKDNRRVRIWCQMVLRKGTGHPDFEGYYYTWEYKEEI